MVAPAHGPCPVLPVQPCDLQGNIQRTPRTQSPQTGTHPEHIQSFWIKNHDLVPTSVMSLKHPNSFEMMGYLYPVFGECLFPVISHPFAFRNWHNISIFSPSRACDFAGSIQYQNHMPSDSVCPAHWQFAVADYSLGKDSSIVVSIWPDIDLMLFSVLFCICFLNCQSEF